MKTLTLALDERSYPIHVGDRLLERAGELLAPVLPRRAVIVTNPVVGGHHLERLRKALSVAGTSAEVVVVPDGELHKDWQTLYTIHTRLLELKAERSTALIALGGGVIGDVAGFAAATYQRGMPLIQIPTTLLAQVDSAVGGKTAVNHPLGKNMIGAFYQPRAVLSDIATLSTLADREYRSGIAEVIKYGAIRDRALFEWLESNMEALLAREPDALIYAVVESCRIKGEIVSADERESGQRALLNFGHTFGHAIETATGYGTWLHGEAVAAGMVLACKLSSAASGLSAHDAERVAALVRSAGLPVDPPDLKPSAWLELMGRDKKVQSGTLRFILLSSIGSAALRSDVSSDLVSAFLRA